jgi:arylsulfatase A-like enzyme
MTGRAFVRVGIYPGVLSPDSVGGLGLNETTLATALRTQGFTTGMVGKWCVITLPTPSSSFSAALSLSS